MKWNEVTWYSRLGAIILFVGIIPAIAFYIGVRYETVRGVKMPTFDIVTPPEKKNNEIVAIDQWGRILVDTPISISIKTPKLSEAEGKLKIYHDFGVIRSIIYTSKEKIWFAKIHETEGCNDLIYLDLQTRLYFQTDISACASLLDFEVTKPLYIKYCPPYLAHRCFDSENLYAVNLDTQDTILLFASSTELLEDETLISRCWDGNYGKVCENDISLGDDLVLKIGVYRDSAVLPSVIEFTNTKVRDVFVDLNKFIGD